MVKINIDENPELAQQMRIQSIPAVYAFKDGRPVDGFVGALPESQVKQFVQRVGGGAAGPRRSTRRWRWRRRRCRPATMPAPATSFARCCSTSPTMSTRSPASPASLIAKGDFAKARQLLDRGAEEQASHAEIAAARAALELAEQAAKAMAQPASCAPGSAQDPNDHEARFELAAALFAAGEREAAIDELLDLVQARPRMERAGGAQAARQVLRGDGLADPLTVAARRRLSSIHVFVSDARERR